MPLITPEWEYFCGDPEVEELLAEASRPRRAFDRVADARLDEPGVRYGRGRPDAFIGRVAPEPPPSRRPERGRAVCPCGTPFLRRRPEGRYCGNACPARPKGGRPRGRPLSAVCRLCGKTFAPPEGGRRWWYCSKTCANRTNLNCLRARKKA